MINKKNMLGKTPEELGIKDAIHTAIVSVRAGALIEPGQRLKMNEFNEAIPSNFKEGVGVADPFRRSNITRGQSFWLLLDQDAVPNVHHVWEHPNVDFSPPKRETQLNRVLAEFAELFGITYEQLLNACTKFVETEESLLYTGNKSEEELNEAQDSTDNYDLWDEWANEVGYEFENMGSNCCPEYQYPKGNLFTFVI